MINKINFNAFAAMLLIIVGGGSIFGKCNKKTTIIATPTQYTLKISKAIGTSANDTVTAAWAAGSATAAQLTAGIKINSGTSVTLTAHSAQPNVFWNNVTTSSKTFTLTMSKDSTITVAFYASTYALVLNANVGYTLTAYTDPALTMPVADLNKVDPGKSIYILIPKPRAENTSLEGVTGADKLSDTTVMVKMTSNKTITATYILDTTNFEYTLNTTSCTVWGYTGTLKNIEIPATIKGLPVNTLSNNGHGATQFIGIQSIIIPYGVTNINRQTFLFCTNLERVTIPNSVTDIRDQAFQNCSKLNQVIIPNSVKTIGTLAFYNCNALDNVRIEALTPPILTDDGSNNYNTFASGGTTLPELTISVPSSSLADYQSQWTEQKIIYNTRNQKNRPGLKWVGY